MVPKNCEKLPSWLAVIFAPVHSTLEVEGSITYVTVSAAGADALFVDAAGATVAWGGAGLSSQPAKPSAKPRWSAATTANEHLTGGLIGILLGMDAVWMLAGRAPFRTPFGSPFRTRAPTYGERRRPESLV